MVLSKAQTKMGNLANVINQGDICDEINVFFIDINEKLMGMKPVSLS